MSGSDSPARNLVGGLSLAAGLGVWVGIAATGGGGEAWDAPAYWSVGVPLLAVVAAVGGYLAPNRVWRWPLLSGVGQLIAILAGGGGLGLLPLAVVLILVPLAILLTGPALAGGMIARGGWDRALLV